MEKVSKDFVREINKRPEIGNAFTFYSASFPQYMLNVNDALALQKGVEQAKHSTVCLYLWVQTTKLAS